MMHNDAPRWHKPTSTTLVAASEDFDGDGTTDILRPDNNPSASW
jgi:hypothetical protein